MEGDFETGCADCLQDMLIKAVKECMRDTCER